MIGNVPVHTIVFAAFAVWFLVLWLSAKSNTKRLSGKLLVMIGKSEKLVQSSESMRKTNLSLQQANKRHVLAIQSLEAIDLDTYRNHELKRLKADIQVVKDLIGKEPQEPQA